MLRRNECPICHKTPCIASISQFLYCHYCTVSNTWWYSNGLIFSNDPNEITAIPRKTSKPGKPHLGSENDQGNMTCQIYTFSLDTSRCGNQRQEEGYLPSS